MVNKSDEIDLFPKKSKSISIQRGSLTKPDLNLPNLHSNSCINAKNSRTLELAGKKNAATILMYSGDAGGQSTGSDS